MLSSQLTNLQAVRIFLGGLQALWVRTWLQPDASGHKNSFTIYSALCLEMSKGLAASALSLKTLYCTLPCTCCNLVGFLEPFCLILLIWTHSTRFFSLSWYYWLFCFHPYKVSRRYCYFMMSVLHIYRVQ